ncbi:MAG: tyrosine-type recombinase/integrase [Gammaproteobacteria bacterium]|nr:tyrosine-type recombinase/integrase [Gammaproteobacteria bacterium]
MRRIETAKGPAKLTDEHGLYLRVSPRGAKSWIQRLNIQGLRTDNAIGHYPAVGLAEARAVAFERWKVAKAGGDPRKENGKALLSPTFAEAAEAVIAMHTPTWRSSKSGPQWRASLETYAYPSIGELPVSEITPGHVMAVLLPIWNDKRETARRVKQRISAICRWAVAQGYRTDDPAGIVVDAALPRNTVKRRPMPALPYEEVADCIAKVKASHRASTSSKLALEFLVLTAARSAEVRKATWDEFDIEGATWTVPAERMKANREHRVPLSVRALGVLAEAAELSDGSGLVFPGSRSGRPISENTHAKLLRELEFNAVTHGFRSSFRDYAAEQTHTPHAVMEAALAHTIKNKAEAAYARSDLFEKRRALMESWAKYLASDLLVDQVT